MSIPTNSSHFLLPRRRALPPLSSSKLDGILVIDDQLSHANIYEQLKLAFRVDDGRLSVSHTSFTISLRNQVTSAMAGHDMSINVRVSLLTAQILEYWGVCHTKLARSKAQKAAVPLAYVPSVSGDVQIEPRKLSRSHVSR